QPALELMLSVAPALLLKVAKPPTFGRLITLLPCSVTVPSLVQTLPLLTVSVTPDPAPSSVKLEAADVWTTFVALTVTPRPPAVSVKLPRRTTSLPAFSVAVVPVPSDNCLPFRSRSCPAVNVTVSLLRTDGDASTRSLAPPTVLIVTVCALPTAVESAPNCREA